jgi:hypothetical protein
MRIHHPSRERLAAWAFALTLSLSACAVRTTSLRVKGAELDASVTVDDRPLGSLAYVSAHGVALPPGQHRVTVEKTGYFPWDKLVDAHDGDPPVVLDVQLVKIPD